MSGVTDLNLSGNRIAQLPDLVSSLGNLLTINLDDNSLNTLPSGVAGLTSLTRLSLKGNPLQSLPPELGCIHALRTLELDPKARLFPSTLRRLTRTHPPSPARRPPPGRSRARDGGGRAQAELTVPPPEVSRKGGAAVLAYFRRMADARLTGRMEAARLQLVALPQAAPATFATPARPLRCPFSPSARPLPRGAARAHEGPGRAGAAAAGGGGPDAALARAQPPARAPRRDRRPPRPPHPHGPLLGLPPRPPSSPAPPRLARLRLALNAPHRRSCTTISSAVYPTALEPSRSRPRARPRRAPPPRTHDLHGRAPTARGAPTGEPTGERGGADAHGARPRGKSLPRGPPPATPPFPPSPPARALPASPRRELKCGELAAPGRAHVPGGARAPQHVPQ